MATESTHFHYKLDTTMTVDHLSQQILNKFSPILIHTTPQTSLFVKGYLRNHEKIDKFVNFLNYTSIEQFQSILENNIQEFQSKNVALWNIGALLQLSGKASEMGPISHSHSQDLSKSLSLIPTRDSGVKPNSASQHHTQNIMSLFFHSILKRLKEVTNCLIIIIQTSFEELKFQHYFAPYHMHFSWVERENLIMRVINYQQRDFNSKRMTKRTYIRFLENLSQSIQWLDDYVEIVQSSFTGKSSDSSRGNGVSNSVSSSSSDLSSQLASHFSQMHAAADDDGLQDKFVGGDYESMEGGDLEDPFDQEEVDHSCTSGSCSHPQQEESKLGIREKRRNQEGATVKGVKGVERVKRVVIREEVKDGSHNTENSRLNTSDKKDKSRIRFANDPPGTNQVRKSDQAVPLVTDASDASPTIQIRKSNQLDSLERVRRESTFNLDTSEKESQKRSSLVLPHERIGHQHALNNAIQHPQMIHIDNENSDVDSDFDTDESDDDI